MRVPDSGQSSPSDAVHSALADEHRRAVLRTLHGAGEEMTLDTLADEVTQHVQMGRVDEPSRERVRIALHHVHLPKLDECELLDYDPQQRRVRGRDSELGDALLATLRSHDIDSTR
jgi:hypothetical protein